MIQCLFNPRLIVMSAIKLYLAYSVTPEIKLVHNGCMNRSEFGSVIRSTLLRPFQFLAFALGTALKVVQYVGTSIVYEVDCLGYGMSRVDQRVMTPSVTLLQS